eukprot:CAMPEP_0183748262 /NCGR_PEP_ID=MMETSP0737-20130205/67678_1 /TAXON_ID=385413 /ORGANISM="Thalassiosira miniscula, Strain CCMP1093" /LENGTH=838 /DNA_ID=CAMNT_0025983981 /DNA_START=241 /DNA_END=2754 /DNA_ORIENTATION=+
MVQPSDRKRPFKVEEADYLPLSPPSSSSSFQPRTKAARRPLSENRVAGNSSPAFGEGGTVRAVKEFLSKTEGKAPAGNQQEVIDLSNGGSVRTDRVLSLPKASATASKNADNRKANIGTILADRVLSKGNAISAGNEGVIDLLCDSDDNKSDDEIEFVKETKPKSKKGVHFNNDIMHEVHYFKPYPNEQSPSLPAIDEDGQASINSSGMHPSSEHSRATADFTVISSRHGRARRDLRRISKHNLKAALKYGRKVPAHPCVRTGAARWKFLHDGLVYITDATCTREITSYREAITIDPFPINIPLMERHTEVKRILREEPYLCTGHTYIVIDQSGSMRNSDVDGFKSRSHAAYGTLALEFIAEQLNQRPNHDDLFAESVTVIEMREESKPIFERVPFDWVLFNRLLQRPNIMRPSYGGNYNESLALVRDIIFQEYTNLVEDGAERGELFDWVLFNRLLQRPNIMRPSYGGNYNESLALVRGIIFQEYNNLLEDGAERGELPNFSLVFLSDGKPSDHQQSFAQNRTEILKSLAELLKDKFSCYAMGIGAREADFNTLQSMVETVAENGGNSQFVHAGLSAVKLSETFSQISSTLTSHRTTLLGEDNNQGPKQKKDFTMRRTGKIVGLEMPSNKFSIGERYSIIRSRFDLELFERRRNPWRELPDLGFYGANGLEIETEPFGSGSERLAYRFHELKSDAKGCKRVGKTMVAKDSLHLNERETKEFHHDFCLVQAKALTLAEKFNHVLRNEKSLNPPTVDQSANKPPELQFMLCHVYTIRDKETKTEKAYLVESMLPGKFTKYNSNNGFVKSAKYGVHDTNSVELASGRVKLEEFVQAFSHW